jgi:hypothetical protein
MAIVCSCEYAFSWVVHYFLSAFAARIFLPLQRAISIFISSHLPTKTFPSKPSELRSRPAFVNRERTEVCSTGQHVQRAI